MSSTLSSPGSVPVVGSGLVGASGSVSESVPGSGVSSLGVAGSGESVPVGVSGLIGSTGAAVSGGVVLGASSKLARLLELSSTAGTAVCEAVSVGAAS
ncbi:MAG: hypothetical protein M3122_08615 [Actinomycetota bacterium]|nr:hypothetical protein [Actinomycetota bacterium]